LELPRHIARPSLLAAIRSPIRCHGHPFLTLGPPLYTTVVDERKRTRAVSEGGSSDAKLRTFRRPGALGCVCVCAWTALASVVVVLTYGHLHDQRGWYPSPIGGLTARNQCRLHGLRLALAVGLVIKTLDSES
jgi:hypothetical protein